ncbi:NUMOD4 domain-containing protein [Leuconostoc pseudomesenteroides]|uniref:NUMOD4 domain-containing protein n=1 Tax=Leuconostoc pseudomesenteroides TaxID=33968 RepID=UPI0039E9CBF0
MSKEVWRPIKGYEGRYEVSNFGRIKSLPFVRGNHTGYYKTKEIIRKQVANEKGYMRVSLSGQGGKKKMHSVHRLVALAFLPNPENFEEVNHRDFNKENNRVENLEWCDREYNMSYLDTKDRRLKNLDRNKIGVKHRKPVIGVTETQRVRFDSIKSASKFIGCVPSAVGNVIYGRSKSAKGWKFEFESDEKIALAHRLNIK